METGALSPTMAMALVSEGKDQLVTIDSRSLINMIMKALGAKEMPIFTEMSCGASGVKFTIKLDVTSARYFVGQTIKTAVVEGEPSNSRTLAEKNAVMKAIKHLNEKNLIKLTDYSSKVVSDIEENSPFGHVNAALYSLEKMVGQCEVTVDKCKALVVKLDGKDAHNEAQSLEKWEMYGSMREYMGMLVDMFSTKVATARAKATDLEFQRKKYHSRSTERYHAGLRKGYLQEVVVEPKVILDYVLDYIGTRKAYYSNAPTTYGIIKGFAKFELPRVQGVDISGNIEIKAKSRTSKGAEQDAAFKSLMFIEKKYKMKIVDLNHPDRLTAESEHKLLVRLLEKIVIVADDVKHSWGKLVKALKTEHNAYKMDPNAIFVGEGAAKKIEAYSFCAEGITKLATDSAKRYQECEGRFDEMDKMRDKMEELKAELELD